MLYAPENQKDSLEANFSLIRALDCKADQRFYQVQGFRLLLRKISEMDVKYHSQCNCITGSLILLFSDLPRATILPVFCLL